MNGRVRGGAGPVAAWLFGVAAEASRWGVEREEEVPDEAMHISTDANR